MFKWGSLRSYWFQVMILALVLINSIIMIVFRDRFMAVAKGIPDWWLWYVSFYMVLGCLLLSVWMYFLGYERGKRK